ncbi:hypothetical protein D920_02011 [Enterococcus faecalis 13-SD-W-01]|nr:hypothetical protein D920_02011 [Enterococcus faecalis 13-SD-W-01]
MPKIIGAFLLSWCFFIDQKNNAGNGLCGKTQAEQSSFLLLFSYNA